MVEQPTFLEAVITLASLLITVIAIPWLRSQATTRQIEQAEEIAHVITHGVEVTRQFSQSEDKKAWAVMRAKRWGDAHGIRLSEAEWSDLIEDAVGNLKVMGAELKKHSSLR